MVDITALERGLEILKRIDHDFKSLKEMMNDGESGDDVSYHLTEGYPFPRSLYEYDTGAWVDGYEKKLAKTKSDNEGFPITYALIKATCGWSRFCDVTGNNHYAVKEYGDYPLHEIFTIPKHQARDLGFIK